MRKINKAGLFIVFFCFVLYIFAGCGSRVQEPLKVEEPKKTEEKLTVHLFHYKGIIQEGYIKLADAFTAEHPSIEVKPEVLTADYNAVLKTKDSAGLLPEIFQVSRVSEKGMKPYLDGDKIRDISSLKVIKQLPEDIKKVITFSDGRIYTLPLLTSARGLIYSQKAFDKAGITEAPQTLDELNEVCIKLKKAGLIPFAIAGNNNDAWSLGSHILQTGHELVATKIWNEKRWEGQGSYKDIPMPVFDLADVVKANMEDNYKEVDYIDSLSLVAEGKAAMLLQSSSAVASIVEMNPEAKRDLRMIAIPFFNEASMNKLYIDMDVVFAVSAKANLDAVDKFFDFMINGRGQGIFSSDIKSPNLYGIEYDATQVEKDINNLIKSGKRSVNYQYNNSPNGFWKANAEVMQKYFDGQINQEQALTLLDKRWDEMIKNK
jgi:raffinose/stachyose/melibiose transport system substrate-binding protein